MLIAIIGENCVGKSTLAAGLNETLQGKIYSGKDYLRLEKNPAMAESAFKTLLKDAVSGENILYLITEKDHLSLLPDGAFRIVLTAELDTIKARFRERMHGNLPLPVEKMLEELGDEASKPLFVWPVDNTHLKYDGAVRMAGLLAREMEQVAKLSVPLTAEAHWGSNWLEAKG